MDAPPQGFLKLNFDGASRGNPGLGGVEGIFRNAQGKIISLYIVRLGQKPTMGKKWRVYWQGCNGKSFRDTQR
jgi:hypothetical protein